MERQELRVLTRKEPRLQGVVGGAAQLYVMLNCGLIAQDRWHGEEPIGSLEHRMADYMIHICRKGSPPFRSLSSLPDREAIRLMQELYREGSVFWERFKDPSSYLTFRKKVEANLREKFIRKGGVPIDQYPIYLMLGRPKWTIDVADVVTVETTEEIVVPLNAIDESQVSFTYPDSMVSAFILGQSHLDYFEPEYHGKVFTLEEITAIVKKKGLPGEGWETKMPQHLAHYIEAQVWDRQMLMNHYQTVRNTNNGQFDSMR